MTRSAYPAAMLLLLAIALAPIVLHPDSLLYPRDSEVTDLTITHWPAVAFNVQSVCEHGQFPLWRPTIASGGPWPANPQSWLLYPPAWLFFVLPIGLNFNLLLVSHALLAAVATYRLARQALGLGPEGAALAGLAFSLAPWLTAQVAAGHVNVVLAAAWLPVALLGAQRAAGGGERSTVGAVLAGTAWAAALLTHPQIAAFSAAATVAWYLVVAHSTGQSRRRRIGQLGLMGGTALALGAGLLLPLAEALPHLNRAGLTLQEAGIYSLTSANLLTALLPTYGGEPELAVYAGWPVLVLAVGGLALARGRWRRLLALAAFLAALYALGVHGPLFPILHRLLPGAGWLRVPARAWVLVALCLALLAGQGLDVLAAPTLSPTVRRRASLLAAASMLASILLAGGFAILYRQAVPSTWSLAAFGLLTALAILLRARGRVRPAPFALAILLLAGADLVLVRIAWTEMRPPAAAFAWGEREAGYLEQKPGAFRTYSPSYSLPQHTAFEHGLSLADGVDPFQLSAYADFLSRAGGYRQDGYSPSLPPRLDDETARPDAAYLGLLNVAYVVSGFELQAEGLVQETKIGASTIYRNERALPRAFVVAGAPTAAGGEVTVALPIAAGPATVERHTPNQILVRATLEEPGLLVLSEPWYPGWRALINGRPATVWRVQGVLRGLYLEAGTHEVEFYYRPWPALLGLAISAASALGLLAWAALRRRRRSA